MTKETLINANHVFDQMQELITVLSYLKNGGYLAIRTPQGDTVSLHNVLPSEFYNRTVANIKDSLEYHLGEAQKEFDSL